MTAEDPTVGRRFGRFVLRAELGRGGMGAVFRAWDEALGREVALKTILEGADEAAIKRFEREAQAVARLRHPNIVRVHDVGSLDGRHYLSMELIEGRTLKRALSPPEGEPRLPLTKALEALRDVALAVQHAHGKGVIHRDLKPENVILDAQGRPFVLDFGLARLSGNDRSKLTRSGATLGTPAYMSPEQAGGNGDDVDERTDVWGLGAVLYHVLTGRPPFEGATELNVIAAVLMKDPTPPTKLNPRLAPDLETIALRCLEKRPERRYASAEALALDLGRVLAGEPIEARPLTRIERLTRLARRNKPATAGVLVAASATLSLSAAAWWSGTSARRALAEAARTEAKARLAAIAGERGRKPAGELVPQAFSAFEGAARVLALSGGDANARREAAEAARAFGTIALEARQWEFARLGFQRAGELGEDAREIATALARLELDRGAEERRRRDETANLVGGVLEKARAGLFLPTEKEDAVLSLGRRRDPYAAALLENALDGLTKTLAASAKLSSAEEGVAWILCRALGLLKFSSSVAALGRYLDAERDELRAADAAEALRRIGGTEARTRVASAKGRFAPDGPFASLLAELDEGAQPRTAHAYCERGLARVKKRDLAGAIADFTRALERAPDDAAVWCHRAGARGDRGDHDGAAADASRAIALEPRLFDAWLKRGTARFGKGDFDGAVEDLTHAVQLAPGQAAGWLNRSAALAARGRLAEAIADLDRVVDLSPTDVVPLLNRAAIHDAAGDLRGALLDYSNAIELDARCARAWRGRAVLRLKWNDLDGAIADATRAIELDPKNAAAWEDRGVARLMKGDVDGAIADTTRAIELDPNEPLAWAHRGSGRERKGDRRGAIADYERFLELAPRHGTAPMVRAALARVKAR